KKTESGERKAEGPSETREDEGLAGVARRPGRRYGQRDKRVKPPQPKRACPSPPVPPPDFTARGRVRHLVHFLSRLTVKLNGRAEAPDWRRGRTISSSARGAQPPAHHGPFQRWLEDALNKSTVRARHLQRKPKLTDGTNPHRPAEAQPRQSAATSAGLACVP